MNHLSEAINLIGENASIAHFSGPKPEELVKGAEELLGLKFPPTYRAFLLHLGAGSIAGAEFYGIAKGGLMTPKVPNAIWLTMDERRSTQLPTSFVVVSDTGDGGYYVIDVSQKTPDGDSPVIEWWPALPNAEGNGKKVASDFGSFLFEQVRAALAGT
jgi:hypothetical protein